jgi:hypothetical protein
MVKSFIAQVLQKRILFMGNFFVKKDKTWTELATLVVAARMNDIFCAL